VLGLELHPDKLASFATHKHLQQQLMLQQDIVGKPAKQFVLLGIQYNLDNLNACVDHLAITGVVQERRSVAENSHPCQTGWSEKKCFCSNWCFLFAWTGGGSVDFFD